MLKSKQEAERRNVRQKQGENTEQKWDTPFSGCKMLALKPMLCHLLHLICPRESSGLSSIKVTSAGESKSCGKTHGGIWQSSHWWSGDHLPPIPAAAWKPKQVPFNLELWKLKLSMRKKDHYFFIIIIRGVSLLGQLCSCTKLTVKGNQLCQAQESKEFDFPLLFQRGQDFYLSFKKP